MEQPTTKNEPVYRPAPAPAAPVGTVRTPGLAAFLSVVPGLGNIYNGLYVRGISFFLIYVSLFALTIHSGESGREENLALLIPSLCFFWLFNLFDAYRQATLINHHYAGGGPLDEAPVVSTLAGSLGLGVVLVVIGLYGLLDRYFDIDFLWLFDRWPLFIIAFGAWLIFQALRQRQSHPADNPFASSHASGEVEATDEAT